MMDLLFQAVLFVNLTSLFAFVAPFLGLPIAGVSLILLGFNLIYLAYRWPVARRLLRGLDFRAWTVFLLVWPLASALYSPVVDPRRLGLAVYYVGVMLASAIFVQVRGWARLRTTVGWALVVTVFGLLLSFTAPELFETAADLAHVPRYYAGRAFGFFLQPNVAAENVVFMFVVWLASGRPRRVALTVVESILLLLVIGSTGSRGGLVMAFVLISLVLFDAFQRQATGGRVRLTRSLRMVSGVVGVSVVLALLALFVITLREQLSSTIAGSLVDRYQVGSIGGTAANGDEDVSVGERLLSFQQHLTLLQARPLTGYGPGATARFAANKEVITATHNDYLEIGVNYGVPYVIFFLFLLVRLATHPARRTVEEELHSNSFLQMCCVIAGASLTSNTVLDSRTLLVLLGGMLSLPLARWRVASRVPRYTAATDAEATVLDPA